LIALNAGVLPATGGASQDLAKPDVEEAHDILFASS
jgi:hypothetical protein